MNKFYIECLFYGFITLIMGKTIIKIIFDYNKNELNNFYILYKKIKKYYIIDILLLFIGILLFLLFEYIDINNWYCKKICADNKCQITCTLPLKNN